MQIFNKSLLYELDFPTNLYDSAMEKGINRDPNKGSHG